ncbi:transcription elongation factor GreA [Mycoplasma sp. CSL7503-lung]|uniref:transcription elongation factor GreA n=1 Tax=Mycoplasma sp. CSL7503-lung TaxID=536372 RepID=UPI0021D18FFD|nr:transcription elongation factor GreA [Mycoplasma sp. CSL7503-lung]MCU4706760.1 transcription elongation factor GreA [Mycoplasma sp. CSL7503-lung]
MNDDKKLIYLSIEKYNEYKKEYEQLINVERKSVQEALKEARAQGDLSENAEYDAARERQGIVEARISELENILDNSKIIESNSDKQDNRIGINSQVTFLILEKNETKTIMITGSHDADPFQNKISTFSPLAVAMLNHEIGDEVEVEGVKKFTIKIMDVKHL